MLIVLLINLGHYWRNTSLYGFPLGPTQEGNQYKYLNETISFQGLASNTIKNLALHFGTPSRRFNLFTENTLRELHSFFNIQINNPLFTMYGTEFHIPSLSNNENLAGNPFHLLLIILAFLFFIASKKMRTNPEIKVYF